MINVTMVSPRGQPFSAAQNVLDVKSSSAIAYLSSLEHPAYRLRLMATAILARDLSSFTLKDRNGEEKSEEEP